MGMWKPEAFRLRGNAGTVTDTGSTHDIGNDATIPGGAGLVAMDFQTVIGQFNDTTASGLHNVAPVTQATAVGYSDSLPNGDYPLFIIGNGFAGMGRSNAFTVSKKGYSTAYDNIGTGGAADTGIFTPKPAIRMGSTYANNTIEAWGNVLPGAPYDSAAANIGVLSVVCDTASKQYTITLNIVNQNGLPHTFTANNCSVVATITKQGLSGTPGIIEASTVDPLTKSFTVMTWPSLSTTPEDTFGFQFHVIIK